MTAVQFHCPLCTGLFEVDNSFAGMEVSCPFCQGAVAVPAFEPIAPEPPPVPISMFELNCPLCTGAFQATTEMANQEVLCPHCQQSVVIPDLNSPPAVAPPPIPPDVVSSSMVPPSIENIPFQLPAVEAPPIPMGAALPTPPEFTPPSILSPPAVAAPKPNEPAKQRAPQKRPIPASTKTPIPVSTESPLPSSTAAPLERAASLLPPGVSLPPSANPGGGVSSAPSDSMLPPGADSLLPPGMGVGGGVKRVPLPTVLPEITPGTFTIPGEMGVKVKVHEPVKTIRHNGQLVELRQLSPEEKTSRRIWRNILMMSACLILLCVVLAFLVWKKK